MELLVVVAIVVLLVAILIPSLRQAREQARRVRCLAQMKGIGAGSHVYAADDRNELLIPIHSRISWDLHTMNEYEWGGRSGIGTPRTDVTDPLSSLWGTAAGRGPGTRPLNGVIYKQAWPDHELLPGDDQSNWHNDTQVDAGIYGCPSDNGYTNFHTSYWRESGLTSYEHFGNSYAANTLYSGWGQPGNTTCAWSFGPFSRPASRIPTPNQTVLYLENVGRFAWSIHHFEHAQESCTNQSEPGEYGWWWTPAAWDGVPIRGWHGRDWRFNATFADGHAENVHIEGETFPQPDLGHYPAFHGNPEYASWDHYRCVIIRGPGWQIDCLPSPPVDFSLPCEG